MHNPVIYKEIGINIISPTTSVCDHSSFPKEENRDRIDFLVTPWLKAGMVGKYIKWNYLMQDIMNKPENKSARKNLRNCSTSAEATLWKLIKDKQIDGLKFRRQHSVGSYILDFYCPKLRLDIELDGEVHSTSEAINYADIRARFLINEKDIWVIRFENRVVFENPSQIVEEIREVAKKRKIPTTSPCGYSSFPKEENADTTDFLVGPNGESITNHLITNHL